jgi:aspartyl protease family protein
MAALDFGLSAETANGVGYGAPIRATLEVGPIDLADFPMTVNQAPMRRSLLGMSFLNRLQSFEVRGDTLILRWRDGG